MTKEEIEKTRAERKFMSKLFLSLFFAVAGGTSSCLFFGGGVASGVVAAFFFGVAAWLMD